MNIQKIIQLNLVKLNLKKYAKHFKGFIYDINNYEPQCVLSFLDWEEEIWVLGLRFFNRRCLSLQLKKDGKLEIGFTPTKVKENV